MSVPIRYRKDIDGLRAVAVGLVILSHANVPGFGGGFVGVDVFFVISGFLITLMIKSDLVAGTFSLAKFYQRRIRRLIPAYFAVIFLTTLAAAFLLLPDALETYSESALFSSLSLANIFFWQQELLYFSPVSAEQPLLHIWSLAVEEQFYVLWPLFLVLLLRVLTIEKLFAVLIVLILASLAVSQLAAASYSYKSEAYYLLPSRAFELGMGGLAALMYQRPISLARIFGNLCLVVALAFVLVPAIYLDEKSVFPGLNAFWPCLGTMVMILVGHDERTIVNRFLSLPLMVGVGKISYSLYLWHWPIFAFMRYSYVDFTLLTSLGAILLAFFLAYLTWRYVEEPFRFRFVYKFRPTVVRLYLLPMVVLIGAVLAFQLQPFGYSTVDSTAFAHAQEKVAFADLNSGWCHVGRKGVRGIEFQAKFYDCMRGSTATDARKAVLIGDSHAGHFSPFLHYLGKKYNFSLAQRSTPGCQPILYSEWAGFNPDVCKTFRKDLWGTVADYDLIFVAARYEYLSTERALKEFEKTMRFLNESKPKVFLFKQVPVFSLNLGDCYVKNQMFSYIGCAPEANYERAPGYVDANNRVMEILARYPRIEVIDVAPLYCKEGNCRPYLGTNPLYHNNDHLSISGATLLAREYVEEGGASF